MPFFKWLDIIKDVEAGPTLPAGMSRQAVIVDDYMLAVHESFPNLKCKPHTHASTQTTYMIKGKLRMRIGDEEQVISPGEFGHVPANMEHSIESLDEYALALDIFHPVRPDIEARLEELEAARDAASEP